MLTAAEDADNDQIINPSLERADDPQHINAGANLTYVGACRESLAFAPIELLALLRGILARDD
jgi:hypothetical protein